MSETTYEHYAHLEALNIFCDKYEPATNADMMNTFSTIEIQKIIRKDAGINIALEKLSELLTQLQYNYLLEQGNCLWMVKSL